MLSSLEEFNRLYYTKSDGSIFYNQTKSYVGFQRNVELLIELSKLKK